MNELSIDPDRLLDINEAAGLLQVKVGTLYSWVSKGTIPYRKAGSLLRFHRAELMQWTSEKSQASSEPKRKTLRGRSLRVV
jgi:excisionase family DNA binding protein